MAFKAIMKVMKEEGGVSSKAERFAKLERTSLKQEGATKQRVKLVKPTVEKGSGVLKAVKRKGLPSHVATGRLRHFLVYAGRREKTSGGLRREDICRNKRGRYVSLKQQAHGHRSYHNVKGWIMSFMSARTQLKCHGFVAINGRTLMGQALYCRMKKLWVKEGGESLKKEELNCRMKKIHGKGGESQKKERGESDPTSAATTSVKKEECKDEGQSATADPTSAATTSQATAAPAAEPGAAPAAERAAPMDVSGAVSAVSE